MNSTLKSLCLLALTLFFSGCTATQKETHTLVPAIVPQSQKTPVVEQKKVVSDVIGAVEPIYILPMKSAFDARIDTGATTTSIDVTDVVYFERDGKKWISFKITNRNSGESHVFEKPIRKGVRIKRIDQEERRKKVMMDVRFGGKVSSIEVTLAEREDFKYQVLVGRNLITGRYLVDTSVSHTLK